jgi:hypothetical protein
MGQLCQGASWARYDRSFKCARSQDVHWSRCSRAPNGQGVPGLPESSDAPVASNALGSASDAQDISDAPVALFPEECKVFQMC